MNFSNAVPKDLKSLPSWKKLEVLMRRYRTKNLAHESPEDFKSYILSLAGIVDAEGEGYPSAQGQRDLSVKFHWGHGHDFGGFQVHGRFSDTRHIDLLATLIDVFGALPFDLVGKKVLDVGCWTGGTSLLLAAMGAEVVAIEEVRKYIATLQYISCAFDVFNLHPRALSLYDLPKMSCGNFDYILCAGVLYHITDPILALRILYECLASGGILLVETEVVDDMKPIWLYKGPSVVGSGTESELNRSGWSWLVPSPSALKQGMKDVGFRDVQISTVHNRRAFAGGIRRRCEPMLLAGLSNREAVHVQH